MNLFFLSNSMVDLSVRQLRLMASFRKLAIGDLVLLRIDCRLVLVVVNHLLESNSKMMEYPMIAQAICDDHDLPKLLPVLYFNDGYNHKTFDMNGLLFLLGMFNENKLASDFINETIALVKDEINCRDTQLAIKLFMCSEAIPILKKENITYNKSLLQQNGKLLIVEKFFTSQMKQEFYDSLALGLSERESLVRLRRKFPKSFSKILSEFHDKDIYTRI